MCEAADESGHTHIHTHTWDNYSNPRCAQAYRGLISLLVQCHLFKSFCTQAAYTISLSPYNAHSNKLLLSYSSQVAFTTWSEDKLHSQGRTQEFEKGVSRVGMVVRAWIIVSLISMVRVLSVLWHFAQSGVETAVAATSARYGHEI